MTQHRRSFPLRLVVLVGLALAIAAPGAAQDTTFVPTPTLLRRIAEALDGNRTGDRVWVVASLDSLHPVRAVVTSRERATTIARGFRGRYGVFGPYRTIDDPLSGPIVPGCQHDGKFSYMDSLCPGPAIPVADVDSMSLVVHRRGGVNERVRVRQDVDAIFLTLAAIDKFAIPYYVRVIGVDSAAAMRTEIARGIARRLSAAPTVPVGRAP